MSNHTALYRFYDEDERLLYVGITDDLDTRWTTHAGNKHWWPNVARKAVEWHDNRVAAAKAERNAIIDESPLYNVTHSPEYVRPRRKINIQRPHGPAPAAPLHALVLKTLSEQGRSQNWLHKRTGVSRNTIASWKAQPRPPQAGTVLTIADALGLDRGEALRLAGVMSDTKAAIEGTTVDLSEVDIDVLLAEIRRRVLG
ncbi:GIY-YIG nuclease family protein [Streptosporangium sp. NPDC023963]|uniref:GIY-YIG nuclease family protein n=1 Tax=Streptosporangium sp. NPDC023963 TaxID=3155608 RepID=UPI003413D4E5